MRTKLKLTKDPTDGLKTTVDALIDKCRQEQSLRLDVPHYTEREIEVEPDWVTIQDVLAVVKAGGDVEGFRCFAKVDPYDICFWKDPDGDNWTWKDFLDSQYPHIAPMEYKGFLYFGLHPNGKHLTGKELNQLSLALVRLLNTAEFVEVQQEKQAENPQP